MKSNTMTSLFLIIISLVMVRNNHMQENKNDGTFVIFEAHYH